MLTRLQLIASRSPKWLDSVAPWIAQPPNIGRAPRVLDPRARPFDGRRPHPRSRAALDSFQTGSRQTGFSQKCRNIHSLVSGMFNKIDAWTDRSFNLGLSRPEAGSIICIVLHALCYIMSWYTPSPPTKSSGFGGFDSSRLLILRGGNYHVR